LPARVRALEGIAAVNTLPAEREYRIELSHEAALPNVLGFLVSAGGTSIKTSRPSLAEVYLHVIGNRGLKV
jgi:ABC-2 type transport system ATP-binding protein